MNQCTSQGVNFFVSALQSKIPVLRYIVMRWRKQDISLLIFVLLLPAVSAYQENVSATGGWNFNQAIQKLSPQVTSQVIVHGFLLWASVGFLTPIGILIIRTSNKLECERKRKILYHLHLVTQVSSAVLVTVAASLSIKNFENLFNNSHQRMGLALYLAVWLQLMTGFFRPERKANGRSTWFFVHWVLGTFGSLLGIVSIYSGLQAYHIKTLRSATLWTALFTVEIVLVAFGYLLQDKWEYARKQGEITRGSSTMPITNQQFIPHYGKYKPETQL